MENKLNGIIMKIIPLLFIEIFAEDPLEPSQEPLSYANTLSIAEQYCIVFMVWYFEL